MCLKKKLSKKLAMTIVSFHMALLKYGPKKMMQSTWLLRCVPKLMGWTPVNIRAKKPQDLDKHASM